MNIKAAHINKSDVNFNKLMESETEITSELKNIPLEEKMKTPQIDNNRTGNSMDEYGSSFKGGRSIVSGLRIYKILSILLIAVMLVIYPVLSDAAPPSEDSEKHIVLSMPESDAQMGTASSSIPIIVPPGRNGVQPNLALSYSSSNKNSGFVGVGWDLNLGYIQRNTRFGLNYSNDGNNAFVVSMEGASGELVSLGSGNYRLEIEGAYYKFRYLGATYGWEVTSNDGTKYYFGQNYQSRQYDPSNSSRVFKWCLDEVKDTNNNYMVIDYSNRYNNSYYDNEIYPKEIRYTGHYYPSLSPSYSVKFYLENKTTQPAPYYNPGFKVIPSKRIKTIEVKYSTTLVRAYSLSYAISPASKKTLLTSVLQYGSNAQINQSTGGITSGSALPAINLEYYNNPRSYLAYSNQSVKSARKYYPSQADFNGDGKTDFLIRQNYSDQIRYDVYLSDGDGVFSFYSPDYTITIPCGVIIIPVIPPPNNVILVNHYVNIVPGDFDGDGNADLFYYNREGEKKIYLSNGDGTFTEQSAITSLGGNIWGGNPTLIDFDGDGDMDFLASKTTPFNPQPGQQEPTVTILGWYLYESNGNGTFTNRGVINFGATGSQL